MALKFLNKKGWHTGSLRNIENVWKAEQKHGAEQKKLEELRKQIQEERERSEFRLLQEQAGLVPKQERLDFLYDSGLAVGKSSSEGFKSLETFPKTQTDTPSSSSAKQQQQPSVPGALFEEKPQSANDTWRKLHSDPLLLIRQREQEALARIKNNPVQMAMIRKTVEGKKEEEKSPDRKEGHKKHHHKKSKHHKNSSPKHHYDSKGVEEEERRTSNKGRSSKYDDHLKKATLSSEELHERDIRGKKNSDKDLKYKERHKNYDSEDVEEEERRTSNKGRSSKYDDHLKKAALSSEELHERDIRGKKNSDKDLKYKERHKNYDSEDVEEEERRTSNKGKSSKYDDHLKKAALSSEELHGRDIRGKKNSDKDLKYKESLPTDSSDTRTRQSEDKYRTKRIYDESKREKYYLEGRKDSESARKGREDTSFSQASRYKSPDVAPQDESHKKRRYIPPKLSDEERALRLREMQMDAELHEEQRWKRLKKAKEDDAQEASRARVSSGRNFLDAAHKSVYGAEKGGSSTIEESVRRRKYYLQGRSDAGDGNAFRR